MSVILSAVSAALSASGPDMSVRPPLFRGRTADRLRSGHLLDGQSGVIR